MFGEMPIECEYDTPNCLSDSGGYLLGAGDVFNRPYSRTYGFQPAPSIQQLPTTGYLPNVSSNSNILSGSPAMMPTANQIGNVQSLIDSATIGAHPLLVLGVIAGVIYLITK